MEERVKLEWVAVLRGVAALWVFAFHIWLAFGGLAFRFGCLSTSASGFARCFAQATRVSICFSC